MPTNTVVVTGFTPFGIHKINASWEAVTLLPKHKINAENVVLEQISVEYQHVDEVIPNLWKTYDPKLVVHVGVSHTATEIVLESQAFRIGYEREDCKNNKHPTGEVCIAQDGNDCIKPGINVDTICSLLNNSQICKASKSVDAGRFLCEYVFYTSLDIDKNRTLFVHVPVLDKPYNAEQLASALVIIINNALQQVDWIAENNLGVAE